MRDTRPAYGTTEHDPARCIAFSPESPFDTTCAEFVGFRILPACAKLTNGPHSAWPERLGEFAAHRNLPQIVEG